MVFRFRTKSEEVTMSETSQMPSKRYTTQELAHVEVYGQTGRVLTKMGNLSASGAFFEALNDKFKFKKGDLARITIKLKSLNKVHIVDCEVVWTKGSSAGVQFLKREELQEKLVQFLFQKNNAA